MSRASKAGVIVGTALLAAVVLVWAPWATTSDAVGATPPVALRMSYDRGDGHTSGARLTCRGDSARATGYLRRRAAAACRQARKVARFLASKPPADRICTEIYGGPQKARLRGTIGTRAIDRRFDRRDGCAIADWDRAGVLVPRGRLTL